MTSTQIKIVKHVNGKYVQVSHQGLYAARTGGQYFGYDPSKDPNAATESLAAIRSQLDTNCGNHDCPRRWPRGAKSIIVETCPLYCVDAH